MSVKVHSEYDPVAKSEFIEMRINGRDRGYLTRAMYIMKQIERQYPSADGWLMHFENCVKIINDANGRLTVEDGILGPVKKKDDTGVDTSQ